MTLPKWYNEIESKWAAGISHMFILHGNTCDTVDGQDTVQDSLINSGLCTQRDAVILYDRSSGITFPLESHKQAFYKAIELDDPGDDDLLPRDPVPALRLIERVINKTKPHPRFESIVLELGVVKEKIEAIDMAFLKGKNDGEIAQEFSISESGVASLREYAGFRVPFAAVIISFAETVCPNNDVSSMSGDDRTILVTLQRWARDNQFVRIGPPVFLLTENYTDIHPGLRGTSSRIEGINVPLPNLEERREYIVYYAKFNKVEVENITQAAAMTAGLKRLHIEDIVLRASLENRVMDSELIKLRKDEIVKAEFAEVLELMDPEHGFELIGGMDYVKNFFRKNIIEPIKTENLRRVPLGVLLPGPPGTGKTALSQAVAKESGLNCAALNLSKIFNSWVGSSERNLEKALSCLEALSPCIVIIDEIDQSGLSRENSGDSGVSNRLFKRLLEFMSDTRHRGKIVFVGLTNRPDLMDSALKRPGRFDRKLPILPPDINERKDIFKVMFTKYGIEHDVNLDLAGASSDGYTGAEIEALVLKAFEVAEDNGSQVVMDEHLTHAFKAYVPTTRDIQTMVKLAIAECNDKDLLPPQYRHLLDERKEKLAPVLSPRTIRTV